MSNLLDIHEELRGGGEWLGAARRWMQGHVRNGDTIIWSSNELVQLPFCNLEDFARHVAVAAVAEDRAKHGK